MIVRTGTPKTISPLRLSTFDVLALAGSSAHTSAPESIEVALYSHLIGPERIVRLRRYYVNRQRWGTKMAYYLADCALRAQLRGRADE